MALSFYEHEGVVTVNVTVEPPETPVVPMVVWEARDVSTGEVGLRLSYPVDYPDDVALPPIGSSRAWVRAAY